MPPLVQENNRHLRHHRTPIQSQRKLLHFFLKCLIMVVIVSLFLFFLGFAAIVLLHFLFMSKAFHRRCARCLYPTTSASSAVSSSSATLREYCLQDVVYSAATFSRIPDCAICLDSFQEGDDCKNLPLCKHLFHSKCVDKWIGKKPNCPICRRRIEFDPSILGSTINGDDSWKRLWAVDFEEGTSHY